VEQDSVVGIARYRLKGTWIYSGRGRNFPHASRPAMGPTHPPKKGHQVIPGVKRQRRGVNHPPQREYSYISTPPVCLHGMSHGDLYLLPRLNYPQCHTANTGNTVCSAFATYSCTVFITTLPAGARVSSLLQIAQSSSEADTAS
jgi:hypothetical protein